MSEWKPIDTHPKDGSLFLAGHWDDDKWMIEQVEYTKDLGYQSASGSHNMSDFEMWMECPNDPPKKHECKIYGNFFCMRNIYGDLVIKKVNLVSEIPEYPTLVVKFCPICGEKA